MRIKLTLQPSGTSYVSGGCRLLVAFAGMMLVAATAPINTHAQTDTNMVGAWRFDPDTFTVTVPSDGPRNLAGKALIMDHDHVTVATNIRAGTIVGPKQSMPANLASFGLVLRRDGTFIATNVPAGLFFREWAAMAEASGTWLLRNQPVGGNSTNEYQDFTLMFVKPSAAAWGGPVSSFQRNSSSPGKKFLTVFLGRGDNHQIALIKTD